jgi:hypothetical protein
MGLILEFPWSPSPRGPDHADDSLTARVHVDVLDRHLLLTLAAVPVQSVHDPYSGGATSDSLPRNTQRVYDEQYREQQEATEREKVRRNFDKLPPRRLVRLGADENVTARLPTSRRACTGKATIGCIASTTTLLSGRSWG